MPKRVPADLADAGTYGCRFDLPVKDALLPARLPFSIRKYPVKGFSMQAPLPVCPEGIGQTRINRKRKARGFRLRITDSAVDNTSLHQQRAILPIKVAPLQAHYLAGTQTEAGRDQNHSSVRLSKFSEDQTHVIHAEHPWDRATPATLPHQINGVDVGDLPPPSMLKDKVQKTAKIHLGLVRQGQRSEPLLNFDRFDFVGRASTPTRSYPAMQAGEMRLLGSISQQWQFLLDVVIRQSIQRHG